MLKIKYIKEISFKRELRNKRFNGSIFIRKQRFSILRAFNSLTFNLIIIFIKRVKRNEIKNFYYSFFIDTSLLVLNKKRRTCL